MFLFLYLWIINRERDQQFFFLLKTVFLDYKRVYIVNFFVRIRTVGSQVYIETRARTSSSSQYYKLSNYGEI